MFMTQVIPVHTDHCHHDSVMWAGVVPRLDQASLGPLLDMRQKRDLIFYGHGYHRKRFF